MSVTTLLRSFHGCKTALLTTYRSDGVRCVNTPISIVVDGSRVLFRTWEDSGKAKRLRQCPEADLRPSTFRGEPLGKPTRGHVRLLESEESRHAARLLGRRHPVLQRWAVPISHRLMRHQTLHYEFVPYDGGEVESLEGWPD
ncbi:PPOX class F420-dependent oxidoreductase [Halostreptopolyspora alba]|uniref:PPOX class F420-dependent oxidoreductase n=1 Tax=Halostreptopolyspora alba TaxID=2487137 RepID=A0A3N0E6C8_9ACTN|nr:PPOX class F420-dependent oxidoreductase [Nocardiopsaceae bacterium YIM 96095]